MSNLLDLPTGKGLACFTVLAKLLPAKVADQVLKYGVSARKLTKAVQAMTDVLDDIAPDTMPTTFDTLVWNVQRTGSHQICGTRFDLQERYFAFDAQYYTAENVKDMHYQALGGTYDGPHLHKLIERHGFKRARLEQAFAFAEICSEEQLQARVVTLLSPDSLRASVGKDVALEFQAERKKLRVSLTLVDDNTAWPTNCVFLAQGM